MRTFLLILGIVWAALSQAEELLVIASPQVPDTTMSVKQIADVYALKKTFWADKSQIVPINREASSDERKRFSEAVFNLSPIELAEYLDRLRFQGKLPPLIQTSDQAVLGFVRSVPGAIGYIKANQSPTGVKILMRIP